MRRSLCATFCHAQHKLVHPQIPHPAPPTPVTHHNCDNGIKRKNSTKGKTQIPKKVGSRSAGWDCNKPLRAPRPPPAPVTTPASTALTAGAAAGSVPQPQQDHAGWEREGSPLRAIRTQFRRVSYGGKKGGSVSDEHPRGSAPRSHSERGWADVRLVRRCFDPQIEGVCK